MNVIPKCIDCSGKYPHYENLPETYAAINVYLAANPLEGYVVIYTIHVTYDFLLVVAIYPTRRQWHYVKVSVCRSVCRSVCHV